MKIYNLEEVFLKDYDSSKFEKLSMTTDILIFSVSGRLQENYRKLNKKLLDSSFRRIIANKVKKINKIKIGKRHRTSILSRYKGTIKMLKNSEKSL